MADIVRLKRKRSHDPADTILLSCKRNKPGSKSEEQQIYRRAGTIDQPVNIHKGKELLYYI